MLPFDKTTYLGLSDGTWCNNVGSNSAGAVLDGNRVRERVNTGLRDAYVCLEGSTTVMEGSADEDYTTTGSKR